MSRSVRPFRFDLLPRLRRGEVSALRALAAHLSRAPAQGGRAAAVWKALDEGLEGALGALPRFEAGPPYAFAPSELAERLGPNPFCAVRLARADGRRLVVVVDAQLVARFAASLLGTTDAEIPAPRRATAAEKGVLSFLAASVLHAYGADGLVVDGVVDALAELAPCFPDRWILALDAVCSFGPHKGIVRVLAPESLLIAPAPDAAIPWTDEARRRLEGLSVRVSVVGGAARLPAADVAALEPRDVVLLDERTVSADGTGSVRLRVGRGSFSASLGAGQGGAQITVEGPYERGDTMSKQPDEAVMKDLPVELSCRLGTVTLSAREVLELGPGAVLTLGRPIGAPVELVASGKVVARGELVDVEGELGVRLSEVSS